MNTADFKLKKIDPEYEDYWFDVSGESKKELTKKYMEMCMVEVSSVVYSKKEDVLGVKRLFPFNWHVTIVNDSEIMESIRPLLDAKP